MIDSLLLTMFVIENVLNQCHLECGNVVLVGTVFGFDEYKFTLLTGEGCLVDVLTPRTFYGPDCEPKTLPLHKGERVVVSGQTYPSGDAVVPQIVKVGGENYYASFEACVAASGHT